MDDKPRRLAAVALQAKQAGIIGPAEIVQAERVILVGRRAIELQRHFVVARLTAHSILVEIAERSRSAELALVGCSLVSRGGLIHVDRSTEPACVAVSFYEQGICEHSG